MDTQIQAVRLAEKKRRGINREAVYVILSSLIILPIPYLIFRVCNSPERMAKIGFLAYSFAAAPVIVWAPLSSPVARPEGWNLWPFYWVSLIGFIALSVYCAWRLSARLRIPNVFTLAFFLAFFGAVIVVLFLLGASIVAFAIYLLTGEPLMNFGNVPFFALLVAIIGFFTSLPMAFLCSASYLWAIRPFLVKWNLVAAPYYLKPDYDFGAPRQRHPRF